MKKEYEHVHEDAQVLKEDLADAAQQVKTEVKEYIARITEAAEAGLKDGNKILTRRKGEIDEIAHENVWTVAALAAAAGVVLGALLSRGRR